jgi:transcriptional regulator with XRE-family HTH domain
LYIKQYYLFLHTITNIIEMKRPLLPRQQRMLADMGNQIKLARLRRNITSQELAERTELGRNTIVKIEAGDESVAMGNYYRVLIALGLSNDILLLAKDDVLGRKLQDAELLTPKRVRNNQK